MAGKREIWNEKVGGRWVKCGGEIWKIKIKKEGEDGHTKMIMSHDLLQLGVLLLQYHFKSPRVNGGWK